jgi:hypothetical protein
LSLDRPPSVYGAAAPPTHRSLMTLVEVEGLLTAKLVREEKLAQSCMHQDSFDCFTKGTLLDKICQPYNNTVQDKSFGTSSV